MDRSAVLDWLEVAEWFAVDDRLRGAIITRDAPRYAPQSGDGTGTDDRAAVTSENPDGIPTPRTRTAPPMYASQLIVSAFSLPGRGVF